MKMKKRLSAIICSTLVMSVLLTGCGKVEPISSEIFSSAVEANESYTLMPIALSDAEQAFVQNASCCLNEDGEHILEFYEFVDRDSAANAYAASVEDAETFVNNAEKHAYSSVSGSSHGKYTATAGSTYYLIEFAENTLIYASVDADLKEEVQAFAESFGY